MCQLTGVAIPSTLKTLCVSVFSDSRLKSEVARYNVSGQRVNSSDKGFVLMKMSDGTVRKVIL